MVFIEGLMNPSLKTGQQVRFLVRWLPATISGVLMLVISMVSASSFSQLKGANFWREHTYEVLTRLKHSWPSFPGSKETPAITFLPADRKL